jgi:hypothetical protein
LRGAITQAVRWLVEWRLAGRKVLLIAAAMAGRYQKQAASCWRGVERFKGPLVTGGVMFRWTCQYRAGTVHPRPVFGACMCPAVVRRLCMAVHQARFWAVALCCRGGGSGGVSVSLLGLVLGRLAQRGCMLEPYPVCEAPAGTGRCHPGERGHAPGESVRVCLVPPPRCCDLAHAVCCGGMGSGHHPLWCRVGSRGGPGCRACSGLGCGCYKEQPHDHHLAWPPASKGVLALCCITYEQPTSCSYGVSEALGARFEGHWGMYIAHLRLAALHVWGW